MSEETNYVSAIKKLVGEPRLWVELKHLHTDLLNSDSEHTYLTTSTLESLISLEKSSSSDKKNALEILKLNSQFFPSVHILGLVYELELQLDLAKDLYVKNIEYPPSITRLAILIGQKKIKSINLNFEVTIEQYALNLLEKAASWGYSHAFNVLGVFYLEGIGIDPSTTVEERKIAAKKFFERAKTQNCSSGLHNLAVRLLKGDFPYNEHSEDARSESAYRFLEEAVRLGSPASTNELGNMIKNGLGLAKRLSEGRRMKEAAKLYQLADEMAFYSDSDRRKIASEFFEFKERKVILVQEFFDAIFYNVVSSEEDEKILEGEDFIFYSKTGFPLNAVGSLFQGKKKEMKRLGLRMIIPTLEDYIQGKEANVPELERFQVEKRAEITIDLRELVKNDDNVNLFLFKVNCIVFAKKK